MAWSKTTDLEKTYITKSGTFHPPSFQATSCRICAAAKHFSVNRALVLKEIPRDVIFRTAHSTAPGVAIFVVEGVMNLKQVRAGEVVGGGEGGESEESGAAAAGGAEKGGEVNARGRGAKRSRN
eukprot:2047548-Rhodomonas_salina.1